MVVNIDGPVYVSFLAFFRQRIGQIQRGGLGGLGGLEGLGRGVVGHAAFLV